MGAAATRESRVLVPYHTQEDISLAKHLKHFEARLGQALELNPRHINVHSGSDSW